ADEEKDSAVGQVAQRALARLSDSRDTELLAWFAQQKPRKPSPGLGMGGLPGLPNDLPERPDLSLPGLGSGPADSGLGAGSGLNLEGFGSGKTEDPKLEFPKPAATKLGETNPPEAEKPAAEKPAAEPEKSPE
ncbi:MAG: hypothetical protein L0211_25975, partial [Planctomycetaceae bacterium]|nr:hypothetical protein [Planctomycetaceae bacterium]